MISVAAMVAAEFSSAERVPRERVKIAIRSALAQEGTGQATDPAAVRKAEHLLRHRGYIWPVVEQSIGCYEPEIPSLMQFVSNHEEYSRQAQAEAL